ncbi:MAG: hypothetical protein NTZ53_08380 [Cyanobacteria bacterium]|nr:hypothetical protein [Cyanobacteriota bacterium]
MAWDPALLRKFNATGHFRLLNQVRSELKANPIKRAAPTAADQAFSRGPATGKPLDLRSQGYGRRRSTGAAAAAATTSAQAPSAAAPLPVAPLTESWAAPAASLSPWGRSGYSSASTTGSASSPEASLPVERDSQQDHGLPAESGSSSFRDRLNAIEMR